jgi:hypothetical protein
MRKDFKDYIKSEIDKNGVSWCWIETPLFTPSDFKQSIENEYKSRLKVVVRNDSNKEAETEFVKEEIEDAKKYRKLKPEPDYSKLNFAEKRSGCGCGSFHETVEEFKTYYEKYTRYKYNEFYKEFLINKLQEIQKPKTDKKEKIFFDFIDNVKDKQKFTNELKKTFIKEGVIPFKIMIELMKENKIFIIKDREFRSFYNCISNFFGSHIGSYSGLNDKYKHTDDEKIIHKNEIEIINNKLEPLINKYKLK